MDPRLWLVLLALVFILSMVGLVVWMSWLEHQGPPHYKQFRKRAGRTWYNDPKFLPHAILETVGDLPGIFRTLEAQRKEVVPEDASEPVAVFKVWTVNDLLSLLEVSFSWQIRSEDNLPVLRGTLEKVIVGNSEQWTMSLTSNPLGIVLFAYAVRRHSIASLAAREMPRYLVEQARLSDLGDDVISRANGIIRSMDDANDP